MKLSCIVASIKLHRKLVNFTKFALKIGKILHSCCQSFKHTNVCALCSFQVNIKRWVLPFQFLDSCGLMLVIVTSSYVYRRARSCPRERRGKLMLARRETTLQKMEMPKQTRYNSSSGSLCHISKLFFCHIKCRQVQACANEEELLLDYLDLLLMMLRTHLQMEGSVGW